MDDRPCIFLCSSSEGLPVLDSLFLELDTDFEVIRWNDNFFDPSTFVIENFENKVRSFDYAIFILHPDDITLSRGEIVAKTRDNVIFEYGLFVSILGRHNCFLLEPNKLKTPLKFPSDLYGITTIKYSYHDGKANIGSAAIKIKRIIKSRIGHIGYIKRHSVWPLRVAIISNDDLDILKLSNELLRYNSDIIQHIVFKDFDVAKKAMMNYEIDAAFIDIFSFDQGINLIAYARDRHREIGFCLYGLLNELYTMPNIPLEWQNTLEHYWKLTKDENAESFRITVEGILIMFLLYKLSVGYFGEKPGSVIKRFSMIDMTVFEDWELFNE